MNFRKFIQDNHWLRRLIFFRLAPTGLFDGYFRRHKVGHFWRERIDTVKQSADNERIPRVADAGQIKRGVQVMHNGLRVHVGSYYGPSNTRLLLENKGVHEPQEEYAFGEILPFIKTGGVMVEMGSFWGFYSMWFQQQVPDATVYLLEPDDFHRECGRRNFALNGCKGQFFPFFVSERSSGGETPATSVDDFALALQIPFIDILHSDIQGHEYDMLKGAAEYFNQGRIGYVFISTHSDEVHRQCLVKLSEYQYTILAEAGMEETYSLDGLIVAKHPDYPGPEGIIISKRSRTNSV